MQFNIVRVLTYTAFIASLGISAQIGKAQSTTTPTLDSEEWNFLTLINNYRAQNGAGPLQVSIALENSSQWMSNDMATKNYFSHTDSLGRDPGTRMAAFGYPYYPWGENIAAGYTDAQSVLNGWINACDADSTGACTYAHRANMLDKSFVVIGIARAYNASSTYGWYWTTDFGGYLDATISQNPAPPTTAKPSIASFTATPGTITAGQSTVLTWSGSGATSVSLNGTTVSTTSKTVAPSATTTYTLTATNTAGSVTASVTVTVNQPTPQPKPPTAPVLSSAVAKSSTEVDLLWTASTDTLGVAGYQVIRNDFILTSVDATVLTYSDKSVTAGTTYSYSIVAYDSVGNHSAPSNTQQVTTPAAVSAGNTLSIWPNSATPQFSALRGYGGVEVGLKFQSNVAGVITGVRFYKGAANAGTHTGSLWSSAGVLLAHGTFMNETASGWQTLTFSAPVPIAANTTYVASYYSPVGFFAVNYGYFNTAGVTNGPLQALQAGGVNGPNGVMLYGPGGQFPNGYGYGSNFWVDVLFKSN